MNKYFFLCILLALCMAFSACSIPWSADTAAAPAPTSAPTPEPVPEPTPEPEPEYQYVTAKEAYAMLQAGKVLVLDIQPAQYYTAKHIPGALPTYAYPADSEETLSALSAALPAVLASGATIVTDMGGKAGVHNAVAYLLSQGADPYSLFILEGGMVNWTYADMSVADYGLIYPQYMTSSALRSVLRNDRPLVLLDLRPEAEFKAGHFERALNVPLPEPVASNGYLMENSGLSTLAASLREAPSDGVLLITRDGCADAEATLAYFAANGLDPYRFAILEGGMAAWPAERAHYLVVDEPLPTQAPAEEAFDDAAPSSEPAPEAELAPEDTPPPDAMG